MSVLVIEEQSWYQYVFKTLVFHIRIIHANWIINIIINIYENKEK